VNLKESLLQVAALDTIAKRIKAADTEARAEATKAAKEAHEATGAKSFDVTLNGRKVGGFVLKGSKGGLVVRDRPALIAWAKANYPHEVTTYTPPPEDRLSADFEKTLLANAKAVDGGVLSPEGELIPGVEYEPEGEPNQLSLAPNLDREAIAEAFTRGELEHIVPLALPKGELA
jgi:hypothetical protein